METKVCSYCGLTKPLEEFGAYNKPNGIKYIKARCKSCCSKASNVVNRRRYKQDALYRERCKDSKRFQILGITSTEVRQMYQDQEGLCKLCQRPMDKPVVDHNHTTGKIRALLHRNCNSLLGFAEENPIILQKAIQYLEIFK